MKPILTIALALTVSTAAFAGAKSSYNLFHPTPKDQMREMTMDRPDTIETPHTVDAGHFQVEASVFSYTYDAVTPSGQTITNNYSVMPMILKMGLFNWCDFELGLEPYVHNQAQDITTNTFTRASGFGDTTLRLKVAFFGNDSGRVAIGAIPFVVAPTSQDGVGGDYYEGGIVLPIAIDLADDWILGLQTQYNYVRNANDTGYASEFVSIIGLGHNFTEKWAMFGEFLAQTRPEKDFPWIGRFDTGVTYAINDNLVLDAAVNIGLTQSAEDVNPFVGISYRH